MYYSFGPCELHPDRRELIVGGDPRDLEPQVFDILCLFLANPGRLISHDELIAGIWDGRIVSDSAISARISAARAAIGDDGTRQALIRTMPRRGFRFVGEVERLEEAGTPPPATPSPATHQQVLFTRSSDGTSIAYARSGAGDPLLRAGTWLTHLEHDWHSPIWRPFLDRLGRQFQVIRYDQRGNGLSDWWVGDLSLDRFVDDLEAVADAAELERFALYGGSQGAPIAIAYACRHPERVSHLILHGGFATGRLKRPAEAERADGEAILTLMRNGWGRPDSAFLKMFAAMFIPDGAREEIASLAELQRLTTSPETAARLREAVDGFEVADLMAEVRAPTLVLHARNDGVQPLDQGRSLAAGIAGAEFVMLESSNHVILPHEPAWEALFEAIGRFVGRGKAGSGTGGV